MYKKCLVVYNPTSGRGINQNIIKLYQNVLERKNFHVDVLPTEYKNHARDVVASSDFYDIVFSIGGDGTLNEIVQGNSKRKEKLTICPIPYGTCNDVATMLGFGKDPILNLAMTLDGEIHSLDIGTINDTSFVYVAGIGNFMNIPYETKSIDKKNVGYFAYLEKSVPEFIKKIKIYNAEIIADNVKLNGKYSLIMLSNSNHIAGINNFHKNVCLDDEQMEVLLCSSTNKIELLKDFAKYLAGVETNNITTIKAHEVFVKLIDAPGNSWCIDGEEYKENTNEFNIKMNTKMNFLTPKIKSKSLFSKKIKLKS